MADTLANKAIQTLTVALAKSKLDSLRDILAIKRPKVLVDTLADKLTEEDVETHGNTLAEVDCKAQAYRIAFTCKQTGRGEDRGCHLSSGSQVYRVKIRDT